MPQLTQNERTSMSALRPVNPDKVPAEEYELRDGICGALLDRRGLVTIHKALVKRV